MPVNLSRVPPFYHKYLSLVKEDDLNKAFNAHESALVNFLKKIPDEKWEYRYAQGKWSVKEMIQHLIDAERIFCYRALRFARKDKTELPGFEENDYAIASKADRRSKQELMEELKTVQQSSAQLFQSFNEEQLDASGKANGNEIYVKAIGFVVIGHVLHHLDILRERYGLAG